VSIHPRASWLQVVAAILSRIFWPTDWAHLVLTGRSYRER
jgi:hypothetical protein